MTGFILTYAVIVIPDGSKLDDKKFNRALQITDGVIHNKQPIFMFSRIGSLISASRVIFFSIVSLELSGAWLTILYGIVNLLGVQGVTMSIHLPLNNKFQKLKLDELSNQSLKEERANFEGTLNLNNEIRTATAFSISMLFLFILVLR